VKVTGTASVHRPVLTAAGLEIEIVNDRYGLVQGWIAEGAVPTLAELEIVTSVSPAWPAERRTGSVTSEGDRASQADLVRQLGYDGGGVTIGVISDGIDSLMASQVSGDLPNVTVPPDPRCRQGSGDEGTAMLEIVHDLAPGTRLLFSGPSTSLEMVDTIACLASAADVVVDDLGFLTEPFFEDGPVAQTAGAAVAAGVSYHSAAGNDQGRYLVDDYRAGPGNFHDFDAGPGQAVLNRAVIPAGGRLRCFLQWADPFGASSNDYDMFVVDTVTQQVLDSSENPQMGTEDPQEIVVVVNPSASPLVVGIAILKFAGVPRPLYLLCPDTRLEDASSQFGIFGHPARPEVVAVAAIDALDPGLDDIEFFSSHGPSAIFFPSMVFRPKPDLAAFDGVATTLLPGGPFNPFFGTSAAAPHAAAVAALLLSKNPNLTPAQVQSVLTSTAVDIAATGFDDVAGHGRIDALAAINAVSSPTTTLPAATTTTTTTTTTITTTTTTITTTTVPRCATGTCDDANPCTDDTCDPAAGCQHVANAAPCTDGAQCTVGDRCSGGQCQAGAPVTAGTVSTSISAGVNASLDDCRTDKRKLVRKVVSPLVQAAKAFSRAEVAGAGTRKWTKKISAGEKSIGTARSKLTRLQAKLSPPCVDALGQAVTAGALADTCLR
jgi:subtilisin family serine protease